MDRKLTNVSLQKQIDILTDSEEVECDIETFAVNVNFPDVLKEKIDGNDETLINLLHIACIVWNTQSSSDPSLGVGNVVFFFNGEKHKYDFRVHSIHFSPTLDLENTNMSASISSNNEKELKKLIQDNILCFYISGKMIQKNNGDLECVVIKKLSTKVDQTAYARKYQKQSVVLQSPPAVPGTKVVIKNVSDSKRVIDPNDPFEIQNIRSFKDKWNRFSNTKNDYEEEKSNVMFNEWKRLAKEKNDKKWE